MHADLTDASVHVPTEVVTALPRVVNQPDTHEPGPALSPTYDEIAERALEFYVRRHGDDGQALQDWVNAERQLRSERLPRGGVSLED